MRSLVWLALSVASVVAAYYCLLAAVATGIALGGHQSAAEKAPLESRSLILGILGVAAVLAAIAFFIAAVVSIVVRARAGRSTQGPLG